MPTPMAPPFHLPSIQPWPVRRRILQPAIRSIFSASLLIGGLAGLLVGAGAAQAAWPDKPVRLVVGFAPGGSDQSARLIAQKLSARWGQQVVVENKPGAGGNIGADLVSKAAPDGYTLLLCVNSYTINTTVYRNLQWNLLESFEPLGRYAISPLAVVVNKAFPAKDFGEFVARLKASNGKLNYGSAGNGTAPHLAVELFATKTGTEATHVPYKGSAPSVTALAGQEIDFSFGALSAFDAFIKDGRLRALAVTTSKRFPQLPDVPTIQESGIADFDVDIWYGLLAPAKIPADIVTKIGADLEEVLADPDTQAKLRKMGLEPDFLGPKAMAELMKRDVARWREVAERIKLTMD